MRKLSSSSSSNSGEGISSSYSDSSSDSDSSEDEAVGEEKILDRGDEEQLHVLNGKEAARKKEKRREREKKKKQMVVRRVKVLEAMVEQTPWTKKEQLDQLVEKQKQIKKLAKSPEPETRKDAKQSEAEQQEEEAEESEADQMEDRGGERNQEQSDQSVKRIIRDRNLKERLCKAALPAAGETSLAVATCAHRLSLLAGYTIPRAVSPIAKSYILILPSTLDGCFIRAPETVEEKVLFGILADAGLLQSGPRAESYPRLHFWIQKERSTQEARRGGYKREDLRTLNSD